MIGMNLETNNATLYPKIIFKLNVENQRLQGTKKKFFGKK